MTSSIKDARPIVGVIETPTLRPDGSILQEPGYDPATGVLYKPDASYPVVPGNPKRDDCLASLAALKEVACDFPFAVDAATSGTGKGRLVHAVARIASGHDATMGCALTVLRGYVVAGRPLQGPAWGSFERWSELIPGCLRWLDMEDPMLARAKG